MWNNTVDQNDFVAQNLIDKGDHKNTQHALSGSWFGNIRQC